VAGVQPRKQAGTDKRVRQVFYPGWPKPKNRRRFDHGDRFHHIGGLAAEVFAYPRATESSRSRLYAALISAR
jgi:hypothetical protein